MKFEDIKKTHYYEIQYITTENILEFHGVVKISKIEESSIYGNVTYARSNVGKWDTVGSDIYVAPKEQVSDMFIKEVIRETHPEYFL